ncbi:ABC transporter permease subunit [Nonomuraea fastidiosa]|jgi:ABC-2 type transport system permease protein|uniref:ABC transporter permease subunit n=1 Tax=Nonomuraea TaxID=83681 RepID=UPI0032557EB4
MMNVIRSEWTKIRSVRSTMWSLVVTVLLMIGFSALINGSARVNGDGPLTLDQALNISVAGGLVATISLAALGVLVISSEYRTGGIRTSLMAVPNRYKLLAGKLIVFTATALVAGAVSTAAAIAIGLSITQPTGFDLAEVVRAGVGNTLYLTACGLFGFGLGTLIRHTPGAIVSAIALIMVLPQLTTMLPGEWGRTVSDYFTTNAGSLIVANRSNDSLGPWSGFGVYLAWIAVSVLAGAVLMRRRDA